MSAPASTQWWIRAGLAGLLIGFLALLCLQDLRSLDYWWHLETGERIARSGRVPTVDPYTYSVPGARWIDSHWLHQLVTHHVYALFGHAGIVWWKLVMVALAFGLVAPIGLRRDRPFVSVAALGLALVASSSRFIARPELPSFVAFAAVLALLDRFQRHPNRVDPWVWAIVPIQLVWANFHGVFAVGIGLTALHAGTEGALVLRDRGSRVRRQRLITLGCVVAASALVSVLNPNGLDLPLQTLEQLRMIGPPTERGLLGRAVGELQPTLATERIERPLYLALVALSLSGMALGRRALRLVDVLVWTVFAVLAATAVRNVALFALVCVPTLVRTWNAALDAQPPSRRTTAIANGVLALALMLGVVDLARDRFYLRLGTPRTLGFGVADAFHPEGATQWIREHRPDGPIAHLMNDGGWFIRHLSPDYRVLVDGRLEVFGSRRFLALHIGDPRRFAALDARFGFGVVHALHGRGYLHAMLAQWYADPAWQLVYVDDVSALFVRAPTQAAAVDVGAPDLFPPLEGEHPANRDRLVARTRFYDAVGRRRAALETWNAAVGRYPDLDPDGRVRAELIARLPELTPEPDGSRSLPPR